MKSPKLPTNEQERLHALQSYNLLDTLPEQDYDDITVLASTICNVPIALVTLLDSNRNFFKSHYGIPFSESPREISFCGHAILQDDIFIINDAREDERFKGNPLLTEQNAIFYAGVPLINPEGFPLGTICVFDHEPRNLTNKQIEALKLLAKQVIKLFELRRKNIMLKKTKEDLKEQNEKLKLFASHVSHDLKSPLANIISLTDLLREENKDKLSLDSLEYLNYIEESTTILKDYIDGILMYYKADELLKEKNEDIELKELTDDIKQILTSKNDVLYISNNAIIKNVNKPALSQILINLVDNALKYNDKPNRRVEIEYMEDLFYHKFNVTDNGIGIPKDKQSEIFELFKTVKTPIVKSSTGIGLSTVKNLVEKLGGKITVSSEKDKGSTFFFTIKK